MSMTNEKIEGLDYIIEGSSNNEAALILLHGYGANQKDLLPLGQMIKTPENTTAYFPNAPGVLPEFSFMESRAWFPIDAEELQRKAMAGEHRNFKKEHPKPFFDALNIIKSSIRSIASKHKKVYLGGFSQGAMLSAYLIMEHPEMFTGGILFSGNPIAFDRFQENVKNLTHPLKIFQSHGKADPLLSYDLAMDMYNSLDNSLIEKKFVAFDGGHEIPPQVISELNAFLN